MDNMLIKDYQKEFATGLACTKSLAYTEESGTTDGDILPVECIPQIQSLIIGMILSGGLSLPKIPSIDSLDLEPFYKIILKTYIGLYPADLSNFYGIIIKDYKNLDPADLANFYNIEVHYPDTEA